MKKLLPILLPVIGVAIGIGGGVMMQSPPAPAEHATGQGAAKEPHGETGVAEANENPAALEYIKLNNQFIVPVISRDAVTSIIVLSLSLEAQDGNRENIYAKEPKLRDSFLQVLFDHANMGGFDGAFTDASRMDSLRRALLSVARKAVGDIVTDVLITDLARQSV